MIQLEGQSLDQLDEASEELAGVIERELARSLTEVVGGLGDQLTAAAVDTVTPDDLNRFLTRWQQVVDDVLMGAVTAQYEAASLDELSKLTAALGGILSPAQLATITGQVSGQVMSEASLAVARNRLVGLGEEVWLAARDELVTGLQQGESIADMVDRITTATDEIGETRAQTIARTETIGVRNEASLDVVDGLQVTAMKTWQATLDDRTRPSHVDADGQTVPKEEPFDVGGASMMHPADGRGPAEEVINCRCTMTFSFDEDELMNLLDPDNPINIQAAANPHIHNGAMIALVPTEEDAQRLAIEDMEPVAELHLTLQFLGDADELPERVSDALASELGALASNQAPITGNAFAVDWFNPAGDEPAWVLGVGGDGLAEMHALAMEATGEAAQTGDWEVPAQHQPWVAHVTLAYSADPSLAQALAERVGDITFDRLRLAVGTEVADFPLTNDGGDTMQAAAAKGATTMPKTAQAEEIEVGSEDAQEQAILKGVAMVEGVPTGDGRMWAEGAVSWPDPSATIIPLQWQKETTHGGMNDVTVNVGRLTSLERAGSEIRFEALVDTGSEDGAEVWRRYSARTGEDDLGFIGGVSIVGDDPEDPFGNDVEIVWPEGCPDMQADPFGVVEGCDAPAMIVFHSTRIRALTLVDTPAFVEAAAQNEAGTMVASGAHTVEIPDRPPLEWFREPTEAPEVGTITVTDQGRFYGYVAPKNVAHRGYQDRVVTVPMGNVDYSTWMNRPTILDSGERIATGAITMDCGHASSMAWVGAQHSIDHYDNACSVVATARVGENAYGVWIAGALLPGVTGRQVARMMACQLSGDWRPHRTKSGKREFTAALVVPVPALTAPSMRIEDHVLVASAVPVRLDASTLVAAVIGSTDLPVAPRDTEWDGQAARQRVFDLCTDGDTVDVGCVSRAFLWRDPDQDDDNMGAYSLGFADVVDGQLRIVPAGVAATAGGRGVDAADIPEADKDAIRSRICSLYDRIRNEFDDWPDCPFEDDSASMEASSRAHRAYADHLMASVGLDLGSRAKRVMEGVTQ